MVEIKKLTIRKFESGDKIQVLQLWQACDLVVPWNDQDKDINRKLKVNPEWFLVGHIHDKLVATVMGGYEGHRGWINYLAVHPEHQRQGYAGQIIEILEKMLLRAGCPKINLQVRPTNNNVIRFYESLGYISEKTLSMGKCLIPDSHISSFHQLEKN